MTAKGAETLKVEASLTNEYICDTVKCNRAVRIRQEGNTQYELIAENMCFYSNPKQETE